MAENSKPRRRKSLTKKQLAQPAVVELLALLQTITDDGRVLDEEIENLREWLAEHQHSNVPGIVFLRESVEEVLRDGRVSPEERKWLQGAIETVMPKEERSLAVMRRREAKAEDLAARRAREEAEREEARRNRPSAHFDFMVAGVLHEGRAAVVREHCRPGDEAFLVREPNNRFSANAILVRLSNGMDIGHVPESDALQLAPQLDEGAQQSATIKKVLSGRKAPIPVVWGELYAGDADVEHARPMDAAPSKVRGRSGCAAALIVPAIGIGLLTSLL